MKSIRPCVVMWLLLLVLHTFSCVVFCREPPIIEIPDQGEIMGFYMKMFRIHKIIAYLGIPYAQPPLKERRFQAPFIDNLPAWEGVRNATQVPFECWSDNVTQLKQHDELFLKLLGVDPSERANDGDRFNEDCLYLNVFMPEDPPPRDGYAVIVWLHSGDFARGNASELNPFQLVYKQKMIVVTVAYRLGIFGFFTSMDDEAPGNFGLMDQAAALQWIKRNIKLFNGNPNSVTLMGHGSGAVSASLHLTSGEWSAGLFQRAIIMSGSMLTPSVVRDPTSYRGAIDRVSQEFGCDRRPTSRMMDCLRNVDISILVKKNPVVDWMPVIGKGLNRSLPFIRDDPINLLLTNELQNITLMIGFTDMEDVLDVSTGEVLAKGLSNEMYETMTKDILLNELSELESSNDTECSDGGGYSIQPVIDAFNFVYKPFPPTTDPSELRRKYIEFSADRAFAAPTFALAAAMSKTSQVFVYRFDIKPKTSAVAELLPEWSGVPHNFDLIFSWGMPYWLQLKNQTQWSSEDKLFSDIVMTLWANFAKFSNPTELGVSVHWNNFTENDQRVLIIDRSFNMSDSKSFNYHGIQFWNDYYPKVVNFASQCCNATSGAMSTTIPPSKHLTLANICSITFVYIVSVVIQFELL